MNKNPLNKPPAPSSGIHTNLNDTANSSLRKFNPYQYAANRPSVDSSSLLYGSVDKTSSSSSSSSSKSSDCCSRQNSNASSENKATHLKIMKSKNVIGRDYFTVQNDYGLLPPSVCTLNNPSQRHYLKPPPPIAPPQLPIQHRLSSTSSSTTDSSYCGVGYNLMNSQSCLLNGVLSAGAVVLSKQSNINSSSEVRFEAAFYELDEFN